MHINTFTGPGTSPPNLIATTSDHCSTSIQLQWEPIAETDQNGFILGYTVTVETGSVRTLQRITKDNFIHIIGLLPFTAYNCSVSAQTSVGNGPSAHVAVTTCEDGMFVKNVTSYLLYVKIF